MSLLTVKNLFLSYLGSQLIMCCSPGTLVCPQNEIRPFMSFLATNMCCANPSQVGQYYRITPLEEGVAPPWPGNVRGPTLCGATLTFS